MGKQKKLNWYSPGRDETEALIKAMHKSKVPFKDMLAELKSVRATRQVPWTISAIKEVLKRAEQPEPLKIEANPLKVIRFDDDEREDDKAFTVELSWQEMTQKLQMALDYIEKQRAEEERPVDWRSPDAWSKKGIHLCDLYRNIGLSGEETWSREVLPLFVQQTLNTGKNVMTLLDSIKGHGAERAQIKRIIFGLYAALSREMESNAALRGGRIEALKEERKAAGLSPLPEPEVPRREPEMTSEEMERKAMMLERQNALLDWKEGKGKPGWRER